MSRIKVARTVALAALAGMAMVLALGVGEGRDASAETGGEFRGHATLEACIEAKSALYGGIDGPHALGLLADCNRMWSNSAGLIPLSGVLTEQAQCAASREGAASAAWKAFCEDARWIAAGIFADPNAEPPAEAPAEEPLAYVGEACVTPLHPFTRSQLDTEHTHYVSAAGVEGSVACDREGELGPFGVLEHDSYLYPFGEHIIHTCPHGDPLTDDDAFAKCYEAQATGLIEKDHLYSRTTTPAVGTRVHEHPPEEHHEEEDHGHGHSHSEGARGAGARGADEDHDDCEGCSFRTMWEATAHFPLVLVNRVTWKRYELKEEYPTPTAVPVGYATATVSRTLDVDGTRVVFRADSGLAIGTPPVSDDEPAAPSVEATFKACIEAKSALYAGIDGPNALGLIADCNRMWSNSAGLVPLSGILTEQAQCLAAHDGAASDDWTAFCEDPRWIAAGIFADPNAEPPAEEPAEEPPAYVGDACMTPLHPFTRSQLRTEHTHYVSAAGLEGFIDCDREGELGPFGVLEHESYSYQVGETITHACPPPGGKPLTDIVAFGTCYGRHGTTSWTGDYPAGTYAPLDRVYRIPPGAPGTACGVEACTIMSMWAVGVVSGTSVQWDRYELKAPWNQNPFTIPTSVPIHAIQTLGRTLDVDGTRVEFRADLGIAIGTPPASDEPPAPSPEATFKACIEARSALYGGIDGPNALGLIADCNRMWSSDGALVPLSGVLTEQAQCLATHDGAASDGWTAFCEDPRWIAAGIFADPNAGEACVRPLDPSTRSQLRTEHTHYVSAAGQEGFIACDREGELGPFGVVEYESGLHPVGETIVHSCPAGDPLTSDLAWITCYEMATAGTTLLTLEHPSGAYSHGHRVYRTPPGAACADCTIRSLWTVGGVNGTTVSWSRYEIRAEYPDPTAEPVGYVTQIVSRTLDIDGVRVEFRADGGFMIGTLPAGDDQPASKPAAH